MKATQVVGAIAAGLLAIPGAANAVEVVRTENASLDVGGRLQLLGFAQKLEDAHRDSTRMYLFLKQGRLRLSGNYGELKFRAQMALGGEAEVKAPSPGVSLDLLDLFADVPVPLGKTYVRAGQFKVPYSRERLLDAGSLLFADRSVQNLGFRVGRDVGVALHTQAGPVVAGAGVFTGGGRDIPERYLPQTLGMPMFIARVGYDYGTGENVFAEPDAQAAPVDRFQGAFFLNALYSKDSLVGHSSVFNTKSSEKPLLTNGNWNPYVGKAPLQVGKLWQVGADAMARAPVGPGVLSGELEANFGVYQNALGDIRMPGGRLQAAYAWKQWEVAMRYAVLLPDENFKFGEAQVTGTRAIQEVTPALTYHFKSFGAKLVMDLPIHIGTPVIQEDGVGAYVLMEMPDQASLLKNNAPIARQDVVEARMMFQTAF
jgi:hypothetical protein